MAKNIGPEDRIVRILIGLVVGFLIYRGIIGGDIERIIAGIVAAYLLLSGLLARCIFYKMIDVDTSIQESPYSTTDDRAGL